MRSTLTRLQDTQEIENLQNAYGFYLDKWQWDSATALFADQGTLELAQRGVYVGRQRIRASLEDAFGPQGLHQGEVSDHAFYQPVIHIADDGRTAFARLRELSILGKYGVEAYLAGGTRENQYVKENGVWRIKSDHLYLTFLADYALGGWAHGALPAPGPSKTLPPDRPPSVNYMPFPAFEELPFHYPNPVSGNWVKTAGESLRRPLQSGNLQDRALIRVLEVECRTAAGTPPRPVTRTACRLPAAWRVRAHSARP